MGVSAEDTGLGSRKLFFQKLKWDQATAGGPVRQRQAGFQQHNRPVRVLPSSLPLPPAGPRRQAGILCFVPTTCPGTQVGSCPSHPYTEHKDNSVQPGPSQDLSWPQLLSSRAPGLSQQKRAGPLGDSSRVWQLFLDSRCGQS